MIKAYLIDGDGVTLAKSRYFSDIYSKEYNVPIEKIMPFFQEKFRLCQIGQADLKQELIPYLEQWGWQGSLEDFLDYWFKSNTVPNEGVLSALATLKKKGLNCYLATDQEKYRAAYISNELNLKDYFEGFFYSCDLGVRKNDISFFQQISQKLGLKPAEIEYWDDEIENVERAKSLGIHAFKYESVENFSAYIRQST